mmetsp:Transcript_35684/g.114131  ORF Transcript_35684/g.114131 Transcript_35684/m.114131 type:complete len:565 (-) Transcript_35684:1541-3235(-)
MVKANRKSGRRKALAKKAPAMSGMSGKKKLSRLGRKRKAGEESVHVSRAVVLRRLQVTLKDFRRLCILKGIYPRDVKDKKKTWYHAKDVLALSREPLLAKFRDFKTFMKRVRRLVGRKDLPNARKKHDQLPTYVLHHLVKERYPKFRDALSDLDDALSTAFLFRSLPAEGRISVDRIAKCDELCRRWDQYVATTGSLKKAFVSVKGVYFAARVNKVDVHWIVPHAFSHDLPSKRKVDYRVMLTFLEFYEILIKFVLFKLFRDDADKFVGDDDVDAKIIRTKEADDDDNAKKIITKEGDDDTTKKITKEADDDTTKKIAKEGDVSSSLLKKETRVFTGLKFGFSREARYAWLELVAKAGGGAVVDENDATHFVTDRPLVSATVVAAEKVQPQWLVDSFNNDRLLPIARYAPGAVLPPHLSPFVADDDYVPAYQEELDKQRSAFHEFNTHLSDADERRANKRQKKKNTPDGDDEKDGDDGDDKKRDDVVEDLPASDEGDEEPEAREKKKKQAPQDDADLAKIMMSKKAKRLHGRMLHGIQRKKDAVDRLKARRTRIESQQREGPPE